MLIFARRSCIIALFYSDREVHSRRLFLAILNEIEAPQRLYYRIITYQCLVHVVVPVEQTMTTK